MVAMKTFDLEEVPMVGGRSLLRKRKSTWCKRYGTSVALICLSVISLTMSLVTVWLYVNAQAQRETDSGEHSPMYAAATNANSTDTQAPAYAHKVLRIDFQAYKPTDSNTHDSNYLLRLNPDNENGAYETSLGVKLLPHGIKLILPGTYFVYKSIYFTAFTRTKCGEMHSESFTSLLVQNSTIHSGGVTTLLQSIHTCCPTCREHSETAFAGGVFYLEKDDIVQVEVTGKDWVDVERDITYVGLMKLGSLQ